MAYVFPHGRFPKIAISGISLLSLLFVLIVRGATLPSKRATILLWNASSEPYASITHNGSLKIGDKVFSSRIEGQGTGPQTFSIVRDATSSGGEVLHYLVLSQQNDGHKARAEHYLHIEPLNATFFSEFSIKLDREFTAVDFKRPDGGPNWCILRQWHQGVSFPPPLAFRVEQGTNNVASWGIISGGDANGHHGTSLSFGEKNWNLASGITFAFAGISARTITAK